MTASSLIDSAPLTFSTVAMPRMNFTEAQAHSLIAKHGAAMVVAIPLPGEDGQSEAMGVGDDWDVDARVDKPNMAVWRLGIAPGLSDTLRATCTICREVEWAGGRLRLHVSPATMSAWLNASLPAAALDELADPLLATAVETLLSHVCSALDVAATCGRPRVLDDGIPVKALPHGWTLTARHEETGQTTFAMLEADTLGMLLLANLIKRAPPVANGIEDDDLPVTVHADLGWTTLRAGELFTLHAQDTVFIDHYPVTPEGCLWLVAGRYGLQLRPQDNYYCVIKGWTSLMDQISEMPEDFDKEDFFDDDQPELESAQQFDVDAVPVRLTFALGERQLTLGELRRLHPGEVFDLARPLASGPVMVRANGRLFATGDLVDIDGRIGVTLRTLGKPET